MKINRNTVCVYHGPSAIDGETIIVLLSGLTAGSTNRKTGDMVQSYILRADANPLTAVKTGTDSSVCGSCPHRGVAGRARSCYVNLVHGPLAVWNSWSSGAVETITPQQVAPLLRSRGLRLGAYGDPAAVPFAVWSPLVDAAAYHTGYTHQWREGFAADLRPHVMASCDTPGDITAAEMAGWRGFFVIGQDAPRVEGMRRCPSDPSLPSVPVPCSVCRACDGAESDRHKGHRWIRAHGSGRKYVGLKMAPA